MLTLYHNPRCSKSRQALALLQQRGLEPKIHLYLENPLGYNELRQLLQQLNRPAIEMVRTHEAEFSAAGLDRDECSDSDIITAIAQYPRLLQRPIVSNGTQAAIGRPPESVLEIL